jgi:hypothetical protein
MRHENQTSTEAARLVLGMARRLHKAALSESLTLSLPVLRRVLATQALHGISLPALSRNRKMVQRKHILRTLAVEAGYSSWETYRQTLSRMAASELKHYDLIRPTAGYPNLWFSTAEQAAEHAALHGGLALSVGGQGVVLRSSNEQS